MAESRDVSVIIKTWLFPSIVTLLGTLIWRDMQEMRNDIKALLAQSNVDKTRIDNLQRQVEFLNNKMLINTKTTAVYMSSGNDEKDEENGMYIVNSEMVMVNTEKKRKASAHLKRKNDESSI